MQLVDPRGHIWSKSGRAIILKGKQIYHPAPLTLFRWHFMSVDEQTRAPYESTALEVRDQIWKMIQKRS